MLFIRYLFARSPIEVRNKSEETSEKHRRKFGERDKKYQSKEAKRYTSPACQFIAISLRE